MKITWADEAHAISDLTLNLKKFREQAGKEKWTIVWAAGAATVASSEPEASRETQLLRLFVEALRGHPPTGPGVFFLVSSAGGAFAGGNQPPFDEWSEPRPLGAYGRSKLVNESLVHSVLSGTCSVVVGRFSNVYGPGQNLSKPQGLISHLALSAASRTPINIFVPLSTVRDYIYADDAAHATHGWIKQAHLNPQSDASKSAVPPRIIASGNGTSVGHLIRITQDVSHSRVPVAMGSHPSAVMQAPDLRFIPSQQTTWSAAITPLPVGIKRVVDATRFKLQERPRS